MKFLSDKPTSTEFKSLGPSVIEIVFLNEYGGKAAALKIAESGATAEHAKAIQTKMDACARVGLNVKRPFYFTVDNIIEVLTGKQFTVTITIYAHQTKN